jgi:hypothetical protein
MQERSWTKMCATGAHGMHIDNYNNYRLAAVAQAGKVVGAFLDKKVRETHARFSQKDELRTLRSAATAFVSHFRN